MHDPETQIETIIDIHNRTKATAAVKALEKAARLLGNEARTSESETAWYRLAHQLHQAVKDMTYSTTTIAEELRKELTDATNK